MLPQYDWAVVRAFAAVSQGPLEIILGFDESHEVDTTMKMIFGHLLVLFVDLKTYRLSLRCLYPI